MELSVFFNFGDEANLWHLGTTILDVHYEMSFSLNSSSETCALVKTGQQTLLAAVIGDILSYFAHNGRGSLELLGWEVTTTAVWGL